MYVSRSGHKSGAGAPRRYFSSFDRFVVLVAIAAALAFVIDGIATRGTSLVDSLQNLLGLTH